MFTKYWKITCYVTIFRVLEADFAVATVLISFGAILGKASALQLILMALVEVVFYNINIYIGIETLGVSISYICVYIKYTSELFAYI